MECSTDRLSTVWALILLLLECFLGYLGSALGNIAVEHRLASSTSSNVHFPLPLLVKKNVHFPVPKVGPLLSGIIKMGPSHTNCGKDNH